MISQRFQILKGLCAVVKGFSSPVISPNVRMLVLIVLLTGYKKLDRGQNKNDTEGG